MSEMDKFIYAIARHLSKITSIPMNALLHGFECNYAAGFQPHHVQAGPWAEMLREG